MAPGALVLPKRHTGKPCAKINDASGQCTVYEHELIQVVQQAEQRDCFHIGQNNDYGSKKSTCFLNDCCQNTGKEENGSIKNQVPASRN